jgi:ABC-2 type transport system ATP-binding protein/lipopolysaccharide transport system ATP-binding protein
VEPEILLIDEWLGAVDEAFLKKAEKRMQDFIEKSSIVVIASHSTALLKKWCNRGVLLRQGQIVRSGEIGAVADDYLKGESLSA